jgi:hypothetical protein
MVTYLSFSQVTPTLSWQYELLLQVQLASLVLSLSLLFGPYCNQGLPLLILSIHPDIVVLQAVITLVSHPG